MPSRLTLAGAFGLALLLVFVALSPPVRGAEAGQVGSAPSHVALVGVTLIDGTGGPPLADITVVVSGGRITALGTRIATPVPGGARTVDAWYRKGQVFLQLRRTSDARAAFQTALTLVPGHPGATRELSKLKG
jgi:hypothetical protein